MQNEWEKSWENWCEKVDVVNKSSEKKEIVDAVESEVKKTDVAIKLGITKSILSVFLKRKDKICSSISDVRKHNRKCEYPLLEEKLIEWLRYGRSENVLVAGNLLKTKAKFDVGEMGMENFLDSKVARVQV